VLTQSYVTIDEVKELSYIDICTIRRLFIVIGELLKLVV